MVARLVPSDCTGWTARHSPGALTYPAQAASQHPPDSLLARCGIMLGCRQRSKMGAGFLRKFLDLPQSSLLRWTATGSGPCGADEGYRIGGAFSPNPTMGWHVSYRAVWTVGMRSMIPHVPAHLLDTPSMLSVCLSRYRIGENVTLCVILLCPYSTCSLPVFLGNRMQVAMKQYRVVAGIMRLGNSVRSGRYRSLATASATSGSASAPTTPRGSRCGCVQKMAEPLYVVI